MAFESTGVTQSKLLPETLEQTVFGCIAKIAGLILLGIGIALAVSLMTWSIDDPSLTHATSGTARNWLGPMGAIVSDLMMQTLGLAAVIALLPMLVWASQMLTRQRMPRMKIKLLLAPLAVLLLAGALSSLPKLASWPLQHGFGGILGDFGHRLLAALLSGLNPARAGTAAGLLYVAAGLTLLSAALGLSRADLLAVLTARKPRAKPSERTSRARPYAPMPPLSIDPFAAFDAERAGPAKSSWSAPHAPPDDAPDPLPNQYDRHADDEPRRETLFDASTEMTSRTMAERFAPAGVEPQHASLSPGKPKPGGFFSGLAGGTRKAESR